MKPVRNPDLLKKAGIIQEEEIKIKLWGNKTKDISQMKATDWYKYFANKSVQYLNRTLPKTPTIKELAVLKSLISSYSCYEIKEAIDFMWESPESIGKEHNELTIFTLSRNYKASEIMSKAMNSEKTEEKEEKKEVIKKKISWGV